MFGKIILIFAFALCLTHVSAQIKKVETVRETKPDVLLSESLQAVVVTTKDWTSAQGTAQLLEREKTSSKWKKTGESFPVMVGRNGLAWSEDVAALLSEKPETFKREGDGKAPAGIFSMTFAFGSGEKPSSVKLPFTRLEEWTECVDDERSTHYNRVVDRMKVGNFDWKSSEKMLEIGEPYALGVFVAHNSNPVKKGNGSCIFLHIWQGETIPTSGCTAMARAEMQRIAGWLDSNKKPVLIQMPDQNYLNNQKSWKLPKLK